MPHTQNDYRETREPPKTTINTYKRLRKWLNQRDLEVLKDAGSPLSHKKSMVRHKVCAEPPEHLHGSERSYGGSVMVWLLTTKTKRNNSLLHVAPYELINRLQKKTNTS